MVREKQGYPEEGSTLLEIRKYKEDGELQRMAQEGVPQAQYKVGLGAFIDQEYLEAREWFEKSAEQGFLKAKMAVNYLKKYNESLNFPQKTARRSVTVQYEVAIMSYLHDFHVFPEGGISKNTFKWLERAAKKNHSEALFDLGVIYRQEGILKKARAFFSRAARQGHVQANEYLSNKSRSSSSRGNSTPRRKAALRGKIPSIYSSGCADTWRVSIADSFD